LPTSVPSLKPNETEPNLSDEPDPELESEKEDDKISSQPKYEVDSFVIIEVDSIWCIGVKEVVQFCQQSFQYLVHFDGKDFRSSITEHTMDYLVFKEDGWIVKKDLNVFVMVCKTDHEAVIDSLVRLSEVFVDTKSVRIRWAINNKTEVVTLLSMKPMHSSQEDKKRGTKPSKPDDQPPSLIKKSRVAIVQDPLCPRKLLVGLSHECRHYINSNPTLMKQHNSKILEK
jgi:hypothetical protein